MTNFYTPIENDELITAAYNSMPLQYRHTARNSETTTRIRDLQRLKQRLKANYDRELSFYDKQIKLHKETLKRYIKEDGL